MNIKEIEDLVHLCEQMKAMGKMNDITYNALNKKLEQIDKAIYDYKIDLSKFKVELNRITKGRQTIAIPVMIEYALNFIKRDLGLHIPSGKEGDMIMGVYHQILEDTIPIAITRITKEV